MQLSRIRSRGFTIVELLIVIVVIGILAAIVIVAYNGVQAKAKNTTIENTVGAYKNLLITYKSLNNGYPTTTSACVGATADYPSDCYSGTANTAMETGLKTISNGSLPAPDKNCFNMYGDCRRGITYYYQASGWTVDGTAHKNYMFYFLNGNVSCSLGALEEGTYGAFLTPTNRGYTERDSNTTMCVLSLPD
jgi:prepilin-type N-terminal cleavage/methylation domain-containing protein